MTPGRVKHLISSFVVHVVVVFCVLLEEMFAFCCCCFFEGGPLPPPLVAVGKLGGFLFFISFVIQKIIAGSPVCFCFFVCLCMWGGRGVVLFFCLFVCLFVCWGLLLFFLFFFWGGLLFLPPNTPPHPHPPTPTICVYYDIDIDTLYAFIMTRHRHTICIYYDKTETHNMQLL